MKRLLTLFVCLLSIISVTGCTMNNTPTKKVEDFLNSYRNLDDSVTSQMDGILDGDYLMNDTQKEKYKDILKKQYQDLTYEVKEERIDGDSAIVTTEIEVYDLYKITSASDAYFSTNPDNFKDANGELDNAKYIDYRLDKMKDSSERVKYTIDFNLSKEDNVWTLKDINETMRQKIHGLYVH